MFLREFLEITLQYDPGIYQSRRGSLRQASFHLQQQTLPQISRSYSCRIETLHDTQQGFNFLIVHLDPRPKSEIIHDILHVPTQITIIIYITNDILADLTIHLSQVLRPQLFHQILPERNPPGKHELPCIIILRGIRCCQLIVRNIILITDIII